MTKEQFKDLRAKYKELFGKGVPPTYMKDAEWIQGKIDGFTAPEAPEEVPEKVVAKVKPKKVVITQTQEKIAEFLGVKPEKIEMKTTGGFSITRKINGIELRQQFKCVNGSYHEFTGEAGSIFKITLTEKVETRNGIETDVTTTKTYYLSKQINTDDIPE